MSRFVQNGYKVAYIDPSCSMLRNLSVHRSDYEANKFFKVSIEKKNDNLYIIKPPRYLPYWTKPFINTLNIKYISFYLSAALKRLGFKDYTLWIYRPEFADSLGILKYKRLIVDIADDDAAYYANDRLKSLYMKKCSETLATKSEIVIVTASTLYDKFKKFNSRILLAPNGYDSELFSVKTSNVPEDIKNINGPLIGFIGTLFNFLDYDLLDYIIKKNSDKSFVFIGNCESNAEKEWSELVKYKNVFWLGRKKKDDIPSYIRMFDVCINPFKVDDVSKSVSPLKVFEYLALRKPVVSVQMESLMREEVSELIYFAKDYSDFNLKLNNALSAKVNESKYQSVEKYSWDSIFKKVFDIVNETL